MNEVSCWLGMRTWFSAAGLFVLLCCCLFISALFGTHLRASCPLLCWLLYLFVFVVGFVSASIEPPVETCLQYYLPTPPILYTWYIYTGWVGVGWRRRCKTRLSLRSQTTRVPFFRIFSFVAVTTAGGRVRYFLCEESLYLLRQGGLSYNVGCVW